ncbi:diaphanous-related formin [Reticulomyxa filosa]|uniref:Diaphanous-related formin n=1 Tax=Reticulomyxa filosa TaxID=46433 RepID=X6NQ45_RETFI|nr:diaphanous-related formin [Reticulomyxa filosa]|eukprot:ETO28385.1 diaphanous-related formin [Reticulomyxa filosa]
MFYFLGAPVIYLHRDSPHIRKFMEVCLAVGNFINEGTNRGDAKGFRLETFDRLESLKTTDGKMTMFMFIVQIIDNNHKELFTDFPDNLTKVVENAKKMESKAIRDAIGDMEDAMERIGKKIRRANRNLKDLQNQFNKRAGTVLNIFAKLKATSSQVKQESRANVLKLGAGGGGGGGGGILARVRASKAAAVAERDRSSTLANPLGNFYLNKIQQ